MTVPLTTSRVPLFTSAYRSVFCGELGLKNGPSVWSTVGWSPQEGVSVSDGVVVDPEAALRVDRLLLHAAITSATPATRSARRESDVAMPPVCARLDEWTRSPTWCSCARGKGRGLLWAGVCWRA